MNPIKKSSHRDKWIKAILVVVICIVIVLLLDDEQEWRNFLRHFLKNVVSKLVSKPLLKKKSFETPETLFLETWVIIY